MITKEYWEMFRWFRDTHPHMLGRFIDSVSPQQCEDKMWLVDELIRTTKDKHRFWNEDGITIEIIGGWYGFPLIQYLHEKLPVQINKIRLVELDPFCNSVMEKWKEVLEIPFDIVFVNEDITQIPQHSDTRDTRIVINTSCEHMEDMDSIIKKRGYIEDKTIFALQSNNMVDEEDHINCVKNPDELRKQSKLITLVRSAKKHDDYSRFMIIGRHIPVNFFTLKWGTKYGPEYVNRLYGSIKEHLDQPFTFTCITDDTEGLNPDIKTVDYTTFDPFDYPKDRIFTREKAVIMKKFNKGQNVILDLDLLIHNDITNTVTRRVFKPTLIWNWWNWNPRTLEERVRWYGKGTDCFINSSFVCWTDGSGEVIYDYIDKFKEEAFHTYKSFDKYLYYQHLRYDRLEFWEDGLFYNYNHKGDTLHKKQEDGLGCIFNTSHIKSNRLMEKAYELDEAGGWVKEIWESYDN